MMKKVYICAPLGGDVKGNIEKVKQYTRYALLCGTAPVVSHFYALCLDDCIPKERELGMAAGLSLLFGDTITTGMQSEIDFCKKLNIRVRHIKESEVMKTIGGN